MINTKINNPSENFSLKKYAKQMQKKYKILQ